VLGSVFGGKVTEQHRRDVTTWWCEVMGGPAEYSASHGGYEHGAWRRRISHSYPLPMRLRSVPAILLLVLAARSTAAARTPAAGISGRVVASPTCPVEAMPPQPRCAPRPLAATLRIRRVGSRGLFTRVRSGTDGRFRIRLVPATYVVQGLSQGSSRLPSAPPARRVTVQAGHFTSITITYDTGIR